MRDTFLRFLWNSEVLGRSPPLRAPAAHGVSSIRLSVYHWAGMRWVTHPGEGVSQRPTGSFHAIRNLQVATRCLGVFTDSLHPIPHAGAARGGHRNEPQPTATISDIHPPPHAPFSGTTPCIERKFGVQIKISRTLFGFRENPCRFGVFSEGLFFALIFSW